MTDIQQMSDKALLKRAFNILGRATMGVKLLNLDTDDKVGAAVTIRNEEKSEEDHALIQ